MCKSNVLLSDGVQCGECYSLFCYGCADVPEIIYRKRSPEDKAKYRCQECRGKVRSNVGTPQLSSVDEASIDLNQDVKDLLQLLRQEICSQKAETNKRLDDVLKSQEFISKQYDTMMKKLEEVQLVTKRVELLETRLAEKDIEVKRLQEAVRRNEQYLRRRQLEFHGVEEKEAEDIEMEVINLAQQCNVTLQRNDIDAIHRIPMKSSASRGPKPIIVEFARRKVRDQLYLNRNAKQLKDGKGRRVYINESLSPFFKDLLWKVKQVAKPLGYQICTYANMKIIVRKVKGSKAIILRSEEDLEIFKCQNLNV